MTYQCVQMDKWDKLEHPFPYGFKLFWESTHDLVERQMDILTIRSWLDEQRMNRWHHDFYVFNFCYAYAFFRRPEDAILFKLRFS